MGELPPTSAEAWSRKLSREEDRVLSGEPRGKKSDLLDFSVDSPQEKPPTTGGGKPPGSHRRFTLRKY